jgi:hypothetical protein
MGFEKSLNFMKSDAGKPVVSPVHDGHQCGHEILCTLRLHDYWRLLEPEKFRHSHELMSRPRKI